MSSGDVLCTCDLPGHVDGHVLVRGSGQDAEELVEDGGQEVDHHVPLHGVETLVKRRKTGGKKRNRCIEWKSTAPLNVRAERSGFDGA